MKYFKGALGKGLFYVDKGHTENVGYLDDEWVGSPTNRRSTFGYHVFIGGNSILCKSKK